MDFISPVEAAKYFGVTSRTILNWIAAGRFPNAFKASARTIRIPLTDIEDLKSKND